MNQEMIHPTFSYGDYQMSDIESHPLFHSHEAEQLRNELQLQLQRTLIDYGYRLSDTGHPYVANVVLGEVAALLGDSIWNIVSNNPEHGDVDGVSIVDYLFMEADYRARTVYDQLTTGTNIDPIDIQ